MSERVNNEAATAYSQSSSSVVAHLALDLLDCRDYSEGRRESLVLALSKLERAEARVRELGGAARECLSLIDKDASTHARPTTRAVFAVQGILKRALREEERETHA